MLRVNLHKCLFESFRFLNSSGSFDLVYEHLVGSKSQPLIPRFVRDVPGVEFAPYHYLLVEHRNMTHFELPTSPPGSTLALASALQATFEQRQRARFQRLERSMAREAAAAASASGAAPGSGGTGGAAGTPALPESAADADGEDALPQEVKAVLASDASDVWCSARHPLTLYVQLQGCRYLQLEPLTSCRTPGIGRASDAPCQTTQIFVAPRSLGARAFLFLSAQLPLSYALYVVSWMRCQLLTVVLVCSVLRLVLLPRLVVPGVRRSAPAALQRVQHHCRLHAHFSIRTHCSRLTSHSCRVQTPDHSFDQPSGCSLFLAFRSTNYVFSSLRPEIIVCCTSSVIYSLLLVLLLFPLFQGRRQDFGSGGGGHQTKFPGRRKKFCSKKL